MLLDNNLADEFKTMAPWFSVPSAAKPFGVSNLISLLGPCNSVLSNYLLDKKPSDEQDTVVSRMKFKEVAVE